MAGFAAGVIRVDDDVVSARSGAVRDVDQNVQRRRTTTRERDTGRADTALRSRKRSRVASAFDLAAVKSRGQG